MMSELELSSMQTVFTLKCFSWIIVLIVNMPNLPRLIDLRTKWQFLSIHNWMRLVFRHIIFCGSGDIYVALHGGSHSTDHDTQAHRLKEEHLIAYESSAKLALVRNENLWHYVCGKSNLFDYKFTNQSFKLLQNQSQSPALEDGQSKRFIDIILSSIGKILGF